MRKLNKRFLALLLVVVLAFGTVTNALATTASDLSIESGFSANTGDEEISGEFDVTYTFHNATKDTTYNWYNFIVELYDASGNYIDARADAYAIGTGDYADTMGTWGTEVYTTWTLTLNGETSDDFWNDWCSDMQDADVVANVSRSGDVITFTYEITASTGNVYKLVGVTPEVTAFADTFNIHLTGEQVDLTDITFTDNSSTTDETTTTAASEDETTTTAASGDETTTTTEEETTTTAAASTTEEETTTAASEGTSITYTVTSEETLAEGTGEDVTITTFGSTKTGEVTLSGDFKLHYSFMNYSDINGSSLASTSTDEPFYWNNFVIEMVSNGVYVDVRADNAGWLYGAGTDDSITFDVDTTDYDWNSWLAAMTEGQLCWVDIEKNGTTITIEMEIGDLVVFTATAEVATYTDDSEITIYLIGEQCTLSDVYYVATKTVTEEKILTFSEVVPITVSDVYDADMNPYNIAMGDCELTTAQLTELAELFAGDVSSDAFTVLVTNDDGTEYVFSDGEGVYLCFELSAEANFDNILFLYYTEDGWQVAESDYVDDDGRYYASLSPFASGTPIVVLAGNATATSSTPSSSSGAENDTTTVAEDVTTATPTDSSSPKTADTSVWMYIVLLAGAAVVISVFAKKRVTE